MPIFGVSYNLCLHVTDDVGYNRKMDGPIDQGQRNMDGAFHPAGVLNKQGKWIEIVVMVVRPRLRLWVIDKVCVETACGDAFSIDGNQV